MADSQSKSKLIDTQKLEIEVAKLMIHEVTQEDASDPVAIANKIIRGLNQNTIATVKTQRGVENLHERVTPLENSVAQHNEIIGSLVHRNEVVDGYMATISKCAVWLQEKIGKWLLMLLKLSFWGLAYILVDYAFTRWLHTPLPRSIAPSP